MALGLSLGLSPRVHNDGQRAADFLLKLQEHAQLSARARHRAGRGR
jgi:hypothetical protein